jgi:hypothetical protein
MAELGFFGVMVVILVTIPLAWGQFLRIGVRDHLGFLYFGPAFKLKGLRLADCIHVATYNSFINIYAK